MRKVQEHVISLILALAMIFSLSVIALADEEFPSEGALGGGTAQQEFATYSEDSEHAAIRVEDGTVQTDMLEGYESPAGGTTFTGTVSLAEGGNLTTSGADGLLIVGDGYSNGLVVQMQSETEVFTIGGESRYYAADGSEGSIYNSVIMVDAADGNQDYEGVYGVGVAMNLGELRIINSYIATEGARSTTAYLNHNAGNTSLVVIDSRLEAHSDTIWMPPFKLLAGGARTTLLMSMNNSWFYGSEIISNTWGAVSQDSIDADTYVYDCVIRATEGGYGSYQTYHLYLYGTSMQAAQYGAFMCGESYLLTDTILAGKADENITGKAAELGYDIGNVPNENATEIVAAWNAIVVHTSVPGDSQVARGDLKNSLLSTDTDDLDPSVTALVYDSDFLFPGVNPDGDTCGQTYFYTKNLYGSVVLVRSMNSDFTFDNCELRSSNGVIIHSVITYDPPGTPQILVTDSNIETQAGNAATFLNGTYTGDILNEDYQRKMTITVGENATLTGKAISGTKAYWENKWSEENLLATLAEDGIDVSELSSVNATWAADVLSAFSLEGDYFEGSEGYGIHMTVASGGEWVVTADSNLSSLTVAPGGALSAASGSTLTIYYDCDVSSDEVYYSTDGAKELALNDLVEGETYENVVIVVSESGSVDENASNLTSAIAESDVAYSFGGANYIVVGNTAQIVNTVVGGSGYETTYNVASSGGGGGDNPMGGDSSPAISVSGDGLITALAAGTGNVDVTLTNPDGSTLVARVAVTVAMPTAITIVNGEAQVTDSAAVSFANGSAGLTASGVGGVLIEYDAIYTQGIVSSGTGGDGTFTFGGSDGYYDVDVSGGTPAASSGSSYNSVILIDDGGDDNWVGEATYGAAVTNRATSHTMVLDNTFVWISGYGRPAIYANGADATIIRDSYIESAGNEASFMPSHRLLVGSARTNLALGGTRVWYYNTTIVSPDWGTLSTDAGGTTYLYGYNVDSYSTGGGYGTYADNGCNVFLYATNIFSAEFGLFGCGNGNITVGAGSDASEAALANAGDSDLVEGADKDSYIYGTRNALLVHTVGSGGQSGALAAGKTTYATISISNSTLATTGTDENGNDLADIYVTKGDYDRADNADEGISGAFIAHHFGTTILLRGGNADVTLNNVELASSSGVLVQSVVNYDEMGAIYANDDPDWELAGINIEMIDMDIEGDIMHEDYQRVMNLDLMNTSVTGKIVSATQAAWNAVWADESDAVLKALVIDTNMRSDGGYYETIWGLNLSMDSTSAWVVTETSSLRSLVVEAGAVIQAPEGYKLTIYSDADMSNKNLFYDYSNATEVTSLAAGTTYEGVVIVVEKAAG